MCEIDLNNTAQCDMIVQLFNNRLETAQKFKSQLTVFLGNTVDDQIQSNLCANKCEHVIQDINIFTQICDAIIINCVDTHQIILEIQILKSNYSLENRQAYSIHDWERSATCFGQNISTGSLQYQLIKLNDDETQLGAFTSDGMCGICLVVNASGTFLGEFDKNQRKGAGYLQYDNGDMFKGVWIDGYGSGTIHYHNGDKYFGRWAKNEEAPEMTIRSDFGKLINSQGNVQEGEWEHNMLQCPLQNEENGDSMTTSIKQLNWIVEKSNDSVAKTQRIVQKLRLFLEDVETMKEQISPFINLILQKVEEQNAKNETIIDIRIFTDICNAIVADQLYRSNGVNSIKDEIQFLFYNFSIINENCFDMNQNKDSCQIFGVISSKRRIQYQLRQFDYETQIGGYKNNKLDGFCEVNLSDVKWICEFHNHKMNGIGMFTNLSNGEIYEGELQNNSIHGKGRSKYRDYVYEGDWMNDCITGRGRLIKNNGESYVGEIMNSNFHGKGKYQTSKFTYEGGFEDGKYSGYGRYQGIDGSIIEGNWIHNAFIGRQRFTAPTKNSDGYYEYDAEWKLHSGGYEADGFGTVHYTSIKPFDSFTYEGQLLNDQFYGHGRMVHANGTTYEGQFKKDDAWGQGTFIDAMGNKFEGEWHNWSNDEMALVGTGTVKYKNGEEYSGHWKGEGYCEVCQNITYRRNGSGKLRRVSGEQLEGRWEDDKLVENVDEMI